MSHLCVFRLFWEAFSSFLQYKLGIKWWARKRIHHSCEDGIEKSVPRDHRLSSLDKPCDINRWSSGRIFLSHPHTHDIIILLVLPTEQISPYSNKIMASDRSIPRITDQHHEACQVMTNGDYKGRIFFTSGFRGCCNAFKASGSNSEDTI